MKRLLLLLSLAVIVVFPAHISGQENPSWVTQVERVLEEKEPRWRIAEKDVRNVRGYFHEAIILKSGAFRADVTITILESPERAAEQFEGERIAFTNILEKDAAKSTLEGLGDENFMFTGKGRRKYGNIFFKQGSVIVHVFAPAVETAKRFAKYVVDLMPPSGSRSRPNPRQRASRVASFLNVGCLPRRAAEAGRETTV